MVYWRLNEKSVVPPRMGGHSAALVQTGCMKKQKNKRNKRKKREEEEGTRKEEEDHQKLVARRIKC